jgi:hypothetical protein
LIKKKGYYNRKSKLVTNVEESNEVKIHLVIQSNMTPKAIITIWKETEPIFKNYHIPITDEALHSVVLDVKVLPNLLNALNQSIGSSNKTCIGGG